MKQQSEHIRLTNLHDRRLKVLMPIPATITKDLIGYATWQGYLSCWGYGLTKGSAIRDLQSNIVSLYESVMATKDSELGKLPLQWRKYLSKRIENKE